MRDRNTLQSSLMPIIQGIFVTAAEPARAQGRCEGAVTSDSGLGMGERSMLGGDPANKTDQPRACGLTDVGLRVEE